MDPLQLKFSKVFPNVDALSRCSPCQIDECIETVFCLWRGLTSLCEGHVLDNACTCLNPFFVWHNFPAPVNRAGIHQTFIDSVANSVHLNNWKLHGLHGDSTFWNRWWTDQAERDPVLLLCSFDFGMLGSHFIRRGNVFAKILCMMRYHQFNICFGCNCTIQKKGAVMFFQ